MHPIQGHILKSLALSQTLRYTQLKPETVEGNRFVYHLKELMKKGFVDKRRDGYFLTAPGKRYVDKLSLKNFYLRAQPKIVTLVLCKNERGAYLVYKRKQQPFLGCYTFPYGKIHFGEGVMQAATRELKEKTGFSADLKHAGDTYIAVRERGEFVSHMLCHIFLGSRLSGSPIDSLEWKQLSEISKNNFVPGFLKLAQAAKRPGKCFFMEILV